MCMTEIDCDMMKVNLKYDRAYILLNNLNKCIIFENILKMSIEKLRGYNSQIKALLDNRDLKNPDIKNLIKIQKLMIFSIPNLENQSKQFLIEARTFAQLNLFYCLIIRSNKQFEMAIEGVRFFYQNGLNLPKSENDEPIIAIHLLFLLSTHKNQEFYTKLENLTTVQIHYDYVQYVLKMNEAIQEGNYRKVFEKKKQSPLEYFAPFLEKIEDTVRIEVAKSAQKAYNELSLSEALKIFQEPNEKSLRQFITSYADSQDEQTVQWRIEDGKVYFDRLNVQKVKFNSDDLIKTTLFYSEELEKIA